MEEEGRRIRPTKLAPVAMMLRDDAEWLLSRHESDPGTDSLSHTARDVLDVLRTEKALFFNDLVRTTRHLASEVEDALWELVAAGLVTADGFENLRSIIDPKRRRGEGRARHARPRHAAGRWALVQRTTGDPSERIQKWTEQLLLRWGVLIRDLLNRETGAPPWRELLPVLRKLEAQGQIRGGRFIDGFTGEQFARPEALDLLRAVRREADAAGPVDLTSPDPLNLVGIILPGPRIGRLA
ncbi:MAG: hypothetical protein QM757_15065 [Paludibaculum sp.]